MQYFTGKQFSHARLSNSSSFREIYSKTLVLKHRTLLIDYWPQKSLNLRRRSVCELLFLFVFLWCSFKKNYHFYQRYRTILWNTRDDNYNYMFWKWNTSVLHFWECIRSLWCPKLEKEEFPYFGEKQETRSAAHFSLSHRETFFFRKCPFETTRSPCWALKV